MGKWMLGTVLVSFVAGCAPTSRGPGSVSDWRGPTWEDWIIRRNDPWNLPDDTVGTAVWRRDGWYHHHDDDDDDDRKHRHRRHDRDDRRDRHREKKD